VNNKMSFYVIPAKLVLAGSKQGAGIQKYLERAGFRVKHGMTGCGKQKFYMVKGERHDTTLYTY
jgi:hypothetical protein